MKKKEIIKKSNDYTKVINKNNKLKNKYYSLFYIKSDNTLFGISIPKKIGNAVIRNKNKRQIKNIIDNNKNNTGINEFCNRIERHALYHNTRKMRKIYL